MRSRLDALKPAALRRAPGVSAGAVRLGLLGRFTDELFSGLPFVLMPTIGATLGFAYPAVGLLTLVLTFTAAIIEPFSALVLDVWSRHRLMAWGALGTGLSLVVIGVAPDYVWLIAGFALYGTASGPLAHTADVVLVESHPEDPARIVARGTVLDTIGALLGPLLVALGFWLGLDWRWMLVAIGLWGPVYAVLLIRTHFPKPPPRTAPSTPLVAELRENLRTVLSSRPAITWLLFLFALELAEAPVLLHPLWLADEVGMSPPLVALYVAFDLGIGLLGVASLDRWLTRSSTRTVIQASLLGLVFLYPLWFTVPGAAAKFLTGAPLAFLFSTLWPIGRGESLASVPGRAGAVTALSALTGFVPLTLAVALLAEAFGATTAMLSVHLLGVGLMLTTLRWLPVDRRSTSPDAAAANEVHPE